MRDLPWFSCDYWLKQHRESEAYLARMELEAKCRLPPRPDPSVQDTRGPYRGKRDS